MRKTSVLTVLAIATTLSATAVDAALYDFSLSGSRSATFALESTKPDLFSSLQTQFQDVSGVYGGVAGVASSISFGVPPLISSLDISGTALGFTQFGGPLLFTGPTSDPVFTVGVFPLSGIVSGNSTLTISLAPIEVPEPSAWLLMITGFALVGGALRRSGAGEASLKRTFSEV